MPQTKTPAKPKAAPAARSKPAARVEFFQDADGLHRWRMMAPNNRVLAVSGDGYKRKQDARAGFAAVQEHAPAAEPVTSSE